MYAKIIDGVIEFAKRVIEVGGDTVKFPTPEQLAELGYLPVVFTKQPEAPAGYRYAETWAEVDGEIVQGWELAADTDEPSADEILNILLGGDAE